LQVLRCDQPSRRLVTRDALRLALWPDGTFVDFEHGLTPR
jgi:hypothetical protein